MQPVPTSICVILGITICLSLYLSWRSARAVKRVDEMVERMYDYTALDPMDSSADEEEVSSPPVLKSTPRQQQQQQQRSVPNTDDDDDEVVLTSSINTDSKSSKIRVSKD